MWNWRFDILCIKDILDEFSTFDWIFEGMFVRAGFLIERSRSSEDFEDGDFRRYNPRFNAENFIRNLEIVKKVEEIAELKSVTPSQIALAWVVSKGDDVFPIPGTKRIKYLKENIKAIEITLEKNEIVQLDNLYSLVSGDRY